jgi:hypothetical protein
MEKVNLKNSGRMAFVEALSWYLPNRIEENQGNFSYDNWCNSQDSKRVSPEYRSHHYSFNLTSPV